MFGLGPEFEGGEMDGQWNRGAWTCEGLGFGKIGGWNALFYVFIFFVLFFLLRGGFIRDGGVFIVNVVLVIIGGVCSADFGIVA